MHKKLFLGIVTVALIVLTGAAAFALNNTSGSDNSDVSSATSPQPSNTVAEDPGTGEPITVSGTIGCLTPKDTSGPQVLSCAIGLTQDNGKSYALHSRDPSVTGSIPTGQKVQISGTFTPQQTKYNSEGTINVTSVERL
jgi:hypothetical protein